MKIAYLVNQYPQPSQTFIRREITALEAQGVSIDRFTVRRWNGNLVDESDKAEAARTRAVLDVGAGGLAMAILRGLFARPGKFFKGLGQAIKLGRRSDRGVLYHLIYLAEALVLQRWLRDAGVEHVHAHFGTNSTSVALLCQAVGGPGYSFTAHGPEEFDRPETLKLGDKIAQARFVVAISEFGRSQMYRWCDSRHWPAVQVVRCGVDRLFLQTPPTPVPATPRLVCVGRLAEQKGQLVLVEAATRLLAQGLNFELVLIGDGPMRGPIETLIAKTKSGHAIRLAGWMDNTGVRQALLDSRGLVLPSFAEGLPVVIMESLALGRPVISTYVAGIPELVRPGENGWLVPPGSVDALVEAMREALTMDPTQLDRMGRAGAARVAERHDAMREAAELARLFGIATANKSIAASREIHASPLPSPRVHGEGEIST